MQNRSRKQGTSEIGTNKAGRSQRHWRPAFNFPQFITTISQRRHAVVISADFDVEKALVTMGSRKRATCINFLLRNSGYIFIFCVLFTFMQVGFHNGRRRHSKLDRMVVMQGLDQNWISKPGNILPFAEEEKESVIQEHPIPQLMEEAEEKYRKKLGSQSKTLKAAVAEYRRRYRRAPPKGFDDWWKFAQKYDVKMVDEYDGLVEDLKAFWKLSGVEIRRRSAQVGELPSIDLFRIRNGKGTVINVNPHFNDSEVSARARGFSSMTGKFVHLVCLFLCRIFSRFSWFLATRHGLSCQRKSRRACINTLGAPRLPKSNRTGFIWYVPLLAHFDTPLIN